MPTCYVFFLGFPHLVFSVGSDESIHRTVFGQCRSDSDLIIVSEVVCCHPTQTLFREWCSGKKSRVIDFRVCLNSSVLEGARMPQKTI